MQSFVISFNPEISFPVSYLSGYPLESESSASSPLRTYYELIEERGNENYNNYIVSSFDEIKKKLFRYNNDHDASHYHGLPEKYSIDTINGNIHKLKTDVCKLWNEKIELHATLNHNKDLFKNFSDSTLEIIKILDEISDSELIKLLNKKN